MGWIKGSDDQHTDQELAADVYRLFRRFGVNERIGALSETDVQRIAWAVVDELKRQAQPPAAEPHDQDWDLAADGKKTQG
jgi:hypothetical protein